jgi:AbrB family looped-hinge helix DNA binding protein
MRFMSFIKTENKCKEYRKVQGLVGDCSFSVVLPKSIAVDLGIRKGDFVKVYTENNKIIMERA